MIKRLPSAFVVVLAGMNALFMGASATRNTAHAQAAQTTPPVVVDRVAAIINNDVILRSELMMRVAPLTVSLNKISDAGERKRKQNQLITRVLEEMVNEQLVVQAAREANVTVSSQEVQTAINEVKKRYKLDDEQLTEAIAMQGYTQSSYRADTRNQLLRMRVVNMVVLPRVSVSDNDVRARYDQDARQSTQISEVHLQHILISVPADASDAQLAAARSKAAEVIQKEKEGETFATLCELYSDDPITKNTGGDLGWIQRGTIAPNWDIIVFAMSKGETRGPISGPQGLHVFHVSDVKDNKQEPFEKVKQTLKENLRRSALEKQTQLWIDELRKKAHFEIKL